MASASNPEPLTVVAGDTIRWRKQISSFEVDSETTIEPIADGYALTYELRGQSAGMSIQITTTTDGDDYVVNVSAATSAAWIIGDYSWHAYLSSGSLRYLADKGSIEIKPDLATATIYDGRTHARKCLDTLEALAETYVGQELDSFSIGGKNFTIRSWQDLQAELEYYRALVYREEEKQRLADGKSRRSTLYIRFGQPQ